MVSGARAAVVVMGEIARSPRMLNHARELAANGFEVVIVGYRGRDFEIPPGVRVVGLNGGKSASRNASGLWFIFSAGARMSRLFISLFRALLREKPRAVLVQNPPSFPTLWASALAAKCTGARVTIDWHNYGSSLLGLRLGNEHWLVRLARRHEFRAGRGAAAHLCVSSAMADDLMRRANIHAEVLYDRPLRTNQGDAARHPQPIAVCPAGWTDDEDIELLLDALEGIGEPAMTVYITGDGAKRGELAPRLLRLRAKGALVDTGFLPDSEYRDLLCRAALGVSLHRSSSGLDLAMKVVDLFSAGVPVLALDYGGSIREQIEDGVTGFLFRTATELAVLLVRLASQPEALHAARHAVSARWSVCWSDEWKRVVLPVLAES